MNNNIISNLNNNQGGDGIKDLNTLRVFEAFAQLGMGVNQQH